MYVGGLNKAEIKLISTLLNILSLAVADWLWPFVPYIIAMIFIVLFWNSYRSCIQIPAKSKNRIEAITKVLKYIIYVFSFVIISSLFVAFIALKLQEGVYK